MNVVHLCLFLFALLLATLCLPHRATGELRVLVLPGIEKSCIEHVATSLQLSHLLSFLQNTPEHPIAPPASSDLSSLSALLWKDYEGELPHVLSICQSDLSTDNVRKSTFVQHLITTNTLLAKNSLQTKSSENTQKTAVALAVPYVLKPSNPIEKHVELTTRFYASLGFKHLKHLNLHIREGDLPHYGAHCSIEPGHLGERWTKLVRGGAPSANGMLAQIVTTQIICTFTGSFKTNARAQHHVEETLLKHREADYPLFERTYHNSKRSVFRISSAFLQYAYQIEHNYAGQWADIRLVALTSKPSAGFLLLPANQRLDVAPKQTLSLEEIQRFLHDNRGNLL